MRLRDIREDKDLTQQQLATQLHIRQNTYSQYENGQRGLPMDMLVRRAGLLEAATDYIRELTADARPYPPSRRRKNP